MSDLEERPVVVCVDDDASILSALRRTLRNEPYEFLATESPSDALDWVLTRKARIVLADQRMPIVTGLEFLDLVRACSPSTARIMITGQSDLSGVLQRKKLESIQKLIRKPWDDVQLKDLLRRLLGLTAAVPG
jgi:response regulator RpfG family c-di-GMP phosphodiesterase